MQRELVESTREKEREHARQSDRREPEREERARNQIESVQARKELEREERALSSAVKTESARKGRKCKSEGRAGMRGE